MGYQCESNSVAEAFFLREKNMLISRIAKNVDMSYLFMSFSYCVADCSTKIVVQIVLHA